MIGDYIDARWEFMDDWPNYIVSNYGQVYNIQLERLLIISSDKERYDRVRLVKDGVQRTQYVHRLVGEAFVDGYFEGAICNHKDGNKKNNYFENLEWITQKQNIQHAWDTGLMSNHKGPKGPVSQIKRT